MRCLLAGLIAVEAQHDPVELAEPNGIGSQVFLGRLRPIGQGHYGIAVALHLADRHGVDLTLGDHDKGTTTATDPLTPEVLAPQLDVGGVTQPTEPLVCITDVLRYLLALAVTVCGHLHLDPVVHGVAVAKQLAGFKVDAPFLKGLGLYEVEQWCDRWCHWGDGLEGFPFRRLFLVSAAKASGMTVVVTGQVVLAIALRARLMPQELGWHG